MSAATPDSEAAARLRARFEGVERRAAVRATLTLVREALDYAVHDRPAFEHGLDVVGWWCDRQCDREGLVAARRTLADVASRAHGDDDRAAWFAAESAVALLDCALEDTLPMVASRHAWRALSCLRDAAAWPDVDDPEAVARVEARLAARLDEALPLSGGA